MTGRQIPDTPCQLLGALLGGFYRARPFLGGCSTVPVPGAVGRQVHTVAAEQDRPHLVREVPLRLPDLEGDAVRLRRKAVSQSAAPAQRRGSLTPPPPCHVTSEPAQARGDNSGGRGQILPQLREVGVGPIGRGGALSKSRFGEDGSRTQLCGWDRKWHALHRVR